jgi:hypothetical protein
VVSRKLQGISWGEKSIIAWVVVTNQLQPVTS